MNDKEREREQTETEAEEMTRGDVNDITQRKNRGEMKEGEKFVDYNTSSQKRDLRKDKQATQNSFKGTVHPKIKMSSFSHPRYGLSFFHGTQKLTFLTMDSVSLKKDI